MKEQPEPAAAASPDLVERLRAQADHLDSLASGQVDFVRADYQLSAGLLREAADTLAEYELCGHLDGDTGEFGYHLAPRWDDDRPVFVRRTVEDG